MFSLSEMPPASNNSPRIRVRVTTTYPDQPLIRQTPHGSGIWGDHQFIINQSCEEADWWVVASGLRQPETCVVDPRNIVFVANEPPAMKFKPGFLGQFAKVITCDRSMKHQGKLHASYGLPWWAGITMDRSRPHEFAAQPRFGYLDFKEMAPPRKEKFMSVIASRLQNLEGHRARSGFLDALKNRYGDAVDFFGYHDTPLADKWDGLAGYRYHLCIENTVCPDYWTEKIGDPLLAFALPVYHGCPNINDYFPDKSHLKIDINDHEACFRTVEHLLANDPYHEHLPAISEAREKVLDKYNFFAQMSALCRGPAATQRKVTLKPDHFYPTWRRLAGRLRRYVRGRLLPAVTAQAGHH